MSDKRTSPRDALLSRRELPRWAMVLPSNGRRVVLFYGHPATRIREFVFDLDAAGDVSLYAEHRHTLNAVTKLGLITTVREAVLSVPPCVLIAAGVEAMRRAGGGR